MEQTETSPDLVTQPSLAGAAGSVTTPLNAAAPATRFVFVDGLRGLAALGIALYHIWRYEPPANSSLPPTYLTVEFVPPIVDWLLLRTWIGVQFLLVVSGFVIAYTLRNTWVTPREAVSFVVRRIVRLLPPYWVTIALVLLLHFACVSWWSWPSPFEESPSVSRVLAHLVFLQDVLGETPLSAGIWTVCIEMQFYVVCVLVWWLTQRLPSRSGSPPPRASTWRLAVVFGPLALMSLVLWNRQDSTEPWVTHFLCSFFLGMVTWWTLDGTVPRTVFVTTIAVVTAHLAWRWKLENALALTAAMSIYIAGRTGHMHDWLNWRWVQFLGRISYSLYLIHYPVSHLVMWLGWRCCSDSPTAAQASLILFLCLTVSVAAGHLLYVLVEAPSGRCSAWLKGRGSRPVA